MKFIYILILIQIFASGCATPVKGDAHKSKADKSSIVEIEVQDSSSKKINEKELELVNRFNEKRHNSSGFSYFRRTPVEVILKDLDLLINNPSYLERCAWFKEDELINKVVSANIGEPEIIRNLISLGKKVNESEGSNKNTFLKACNDNSHIEIIKFLVDELDVNTDVYRQAVIGGAGVPLYNALKYNTLEIAKLLIDLGVESNFQKIKNGVGDDYMRNIYAEVISAGEYDVIERIEFIHENNLCDINYIRETEKNSWFSSPLNACLLSSKYNSTNILKRIIELGLLVDLSNSNYDLEELDIAEYSAEHSPLHMVTFLHRNGVNYGSNEEVSCKAFLNEDLDVTEYLYLKAGVDISSLNDTQKNQLTAAISEFKLNKYNEEESEPEAAEILEKVRLYLRLGGTLDTLDNKGFNLLHYARSNTGLQKTRAWGEIVKLLTTNTDSRNHLFEIPNFFLNKAMLSTMDWQKKYSENPILKEVTNNWKIVDGKNNTNIFFSSQMLHFKGYYLDASSLKKLKNNSNGFTLWLWPRYNLKLLDPSVIINEYENIFGKPTIKYGLKQHHQCGATWIIGNTTIQVTSASPLLTYKDEHTMVIIYKEFENSDIIKGSIALNIDYGMYHHYSDDPLKESNFVLLLDLDKDEGYLVGDDTTKLVTESVEFSGDGRITLNFVKGFLSGGRLMINRVNGKIEGQFSSGDYHYTIKGTASLLEEDILKF